MNLPEGTPIAVNAFTGVNRSGKSSLLNWSICQPDGFEVGYTTNACTKGLWIWPQPLKGLTTDGREAFVLLIDTEGIDSTDEDLNNNLALLFLDISMSSTLWFHTVRQIDETHLVLLSGVSQLTEKNHQSSSADQDSYYVEPKDYSKFYPQFTWVVRDSELEIVNKQGKPITASQLLEQKLAPIPGNSTKIEEKNLLRQEIRNIFTKRDCVAMVSPLTGKLTSKTLSSAPVNELNPKF